MWTETSEGRQLVAGITHELVIQIAPEEMDLFDELMTDYFVGPPPGANGRSGGDDPLAFGLEGAFVAATPAAAAMVTAALTYIAQEVVKAAKEESAKALTTRVRAYFRPQDEGKRLDSYNIRQIYEVALKEGVAAGLPAKEADRMARALIGKLTLSA